MGHSADRRDSRLETTAKRGRQETNSLSPRNVSVILILTEGVEKGLGLCPTALLTEKREVTPEQKAGALRIHGALRGLQRPPPVLHPALAWLWAGGRGCCWRARYCHTSSFWTPRKPGTVKQRASKEQYATLPIV